MSDATGPAPDGIRVRLMMPDRWLEHVESFPADTKIAEVKAVGLREMLQRTSDDPRRFYTEFAEREVRDEGISLRELGLEDGGVLSIRAYDLGHHPPFQG